MSLVFFPSNLHLLEMDRTDVIKLSGALLVILHSLRGTLKRRVSFSAKMITGQDMGSHVRTVLR